MKFDWIIAIVKLIISQASPELRKLLIESVKKLEEKAKQTTTPWDDLIVELLKTLFGIS